MQSRFYLSVDQGSRQKEELLLARADAAIADAQAAVKARRSLSRLYSEEPAGATSLVAGQQLQGF